MLKSWFSRFAVIGAVLTAVVLASSSPAMADSNKSIGNQYGTFTFIDDGDTFRICDNLADGHGVTGILVEKNAWNGTRKTVMEIDDGGDRGCDKGAFNIGNLHEYKMYFFWGGDFSTHLATGWFNE